MHAHRIPGARGEAHDVAEPVAVQVARVFQPFAEAGGDQALARELARYFGGWGRDGETAITMLWAA
ncbi:MAG TPA: hypothetical protein VEO54_10360 [Thermoanaerobaculia bacterium]|nr:hypothetical protein [Thermoanaerobaculia bacterium]